MLKTAVTAALTYAACAVLRQELETAPPREGTWVQLRPTKNQGAAFGLPLDPQALPVLSAGALVQFLRYRKAHPVGVGLILGGGFSNLQERVERGEVLDYLRFPRAPGPLKRYVFNLADLALLTGALTVVRRDKRYCRAGD